MKTRSLSGVTNVLPVRTALRTTSQLALTDVIDIRDVIAAPPATVDTSPGINGRPLVEQVDAKINPRWLQLACSWHQAGRYPGPVTADLGLAFGALLLVGMPLGVTLAATLVLLASGLLFGLWKRRLAYETQGVLWYLRHLAPASAAVGFFLATSTTTLTTNQVTFRTLAMSSALIGARAILWLAIGSARRRGKGLQSALVVGPPHRIQQVKHRLGTYPEAGLRFEAAYTPGPSADGSAEAGRTLVNSLLGEYDVDHVVCVPDQVEETVFLDFVRFSKGQVDISLVLPVATLCAGQVRSSIGDLGVLPVRLRASWGSAMAKRIVDVAGAAILLALLSPLLLLTGAAIRLSDGGPALFRQPRVGRDGKTFTVFKFRSMVLGAELLQADYQSENFVKCGLLFKLDKDPRVTPIGSVIRRFSIDELPQLINVLRGEMSLVGPRPLAVQPDRFDLRAQIRHQVNPGITGLWQALGANALEYEDMLNLDLAYVTSRSFGVDFLTMLRTVPALLNRRAPY